jgi:hypothetical protein
MRPIVRAALVFAAVLLSRSAPAYVRTTTASGTPIAWAAGCLEFRVDVRDDAPLSTAREKAALDAALDGWRRAAQSCTAFRIARAGDTRGAGVAYDGMSVVVWRLPGFCDDPRHANDEACINPQSTATTTVFYHDQPGAADDGVIVEADIELDGAHFAFDDTGDPEKIDLQTVLAHEVGHALGLDHTCNASRETSRLLDDRGNPQPFCFPLAALTAPVTAPIMFNFIEPGETGKRTPSTDERNAVCSIYGHGDRACPGGDTGHGCSISRHAVTAEWLAVLVALAGCTVAIWRRRRR